MFNGNDIKNICIFSLNELGLEQVYVHTTRLNDRILAVILDLLSPTEASDILLIYDEVIGIALKHAHTDECDSDALIMSSTFKLC